MQGENLNNLGPPAQSKPPRGVELRTVALKGINQWIIHAWLTKTILTLQLSPNLLPGGGGELRTVAKGKQSVGYICGTIYTSFDTLVQPKPPLGDEQ